MSQLSILPATFHCHLPDHPTPLHPFRLTKPSPASPLLICPILLLLDAPSPAVPYAYSHDAPSWHINRMAVCIQDSVSQKGCRAPLNDMAPLSLEAAHNLRGSLPDVGQGKPPSTTTRATGVHGRATRRSATQESMSVRQPRLSDFQVQSEGALLFSITDGQCASLWHVFLMYMSFCSARQLCCA